MDYSSEIADGGTTYYASVAAIDSSSHDTAVFVPDQFHTNPAISVILYLHGHNISHYPDLRTFIHGPYTRPLRKAVGKDGRFALAIPWLQNKSNANYIVASTQAFDAYFGAVLGLVRRPPGSAGTTTANSVTLVLSAHSGGGSPMSGAIMLSSAFIDRVVAAWGFDSMYGRHADDWTAWAKANPKSAVYVYYTDETERDSQKLAELGKSLKNVHVRRSSVGHMEVPPHYFPLLLKLL